MARIDSDEIATWDQNLAELVGSLVHEVKNPLSTLNINAQLTLEEWPQPATPREERLVRRLKVMIDEVDRIETVVSSFLQFVKQEVAQFELVSVNELLGDLVANNAEGLGRQNIQLRFYPDPEVGGFLGDENLLRQAFLNLIRNAEQALVNGGEIIVRTRADLDFVVVEIIDTGEGIPPDRLQKIFRPYFSMKPGGTGLGLPTVLRVVRQHGGQLVVESEPGKGCRFKMTFPRSGAVAD